MQRASPWPPEPLGPAWTCTDLHTCYQVRPAGRQGRWIPTLHADFSRTPIAYLSPVGHQAGDRWALTAPAGPGQGRKGWLVTCSVAAGRTGAPGVGLRDRSSGSPPARSGSLGRRQRPNCRSQLPAPTRRPPPSRPASFLSHPPPAARFYGNRAMLRTNVLPGWTAGDVLFLHHTAVTRAQARLS